MGLEWLVAVITVIAGVVTIVWFVRDIRKENSKVLKAILNAQNSSVEIQKEAIEIQKEAIEIQKGQTEILAKIEEGQRKGFAVLAEMLLNQTKILEKITIRQT
ncbi:MAG: hypothetical protein AB1349_07330 [Elusimicrobiota bacterium]